MNHFIRTMPALLSILFTLSKYGILIDLGKKQSSTLLKIFLTVANFTFYPAVIFFYKKSSFPTRLIKATTKLGPVYIKFGQTISTRPELIGEELAECLKKLQDKLPPFSTQKAKNIIEESTGFKAEQLFLEFSDSVHAASIAQVHKACLHSGEVVAVKILRPNIQTIYQKNIKVLRSLAKCLSLFSKMKRLKLIEVIDVFQNTMECELNLKLEAAACSEIADNFLGDNDLYVPKVYWQCTSEKVLTLEWIEGISIYDLESISNYQIDVKSLSKKIATIFLNQAYRDGLFHADLHPGNILVLPNGKIALIDFGIVGRLALKDRIAVAEILHSFLQSNYKKVAEIHHQIGYIPKNTNLELFAQYCRAVAEPIITLPLQKVSLSQLLMQLFVITEKFGMETQPQLLLLQKTMVVVEGIGKSLNPETNMWILAEAWMQKWAAKNISPEAKFLRFTRKTIENIITRIESKLKI